MSEKNNETKYIGSIRKQITVIMLLLSLSGLILISALFFVQVRRLYTQTVDNASALEESTTQISRSALEEQTIAALQTRVRSNALRSNSHMSSIQQYTHLVAQAAQHIYENPRQYELQEIVYYDPATLGTLSSDLVYAQGVRIEGAVRTEAMLLFNMTVIQEGIIANDPNIPIIYVGTETGVWLFTESTNSGRPQYNDPRERPWYQAVKEAGAATWSAPYDDVLGGGLAITYAVPVYKNDVLVAVAGIGGRLNTLEDIVMEIGANTAQGALGERAFILNEKGEIILGHGIERAADGSSVQVDLLADPQLSALVAQMMNGESGVENCMFEGRESYIAYYPIESMGWTMVIVADEQEAFSAVAVLEESVHEITQDSVHAINALATSTLGLLIIILVALVCAIIVVAYYVARHFTNPILALTESAAEVGTGNLDVAFDIHTGNEIELLANSFAEMQQNLKLYISESARLDSASRAKSDFLSRMSHEIRTPMNAIIGMTQIAEKTDDVQRLKHCIEVIDASSVQLLGIINDILDISKIEAGKIEIDHVPFNIDTLLASSLNLFADQIEKKGQTLNVHVEQAMWKDYIGDSQRLLQVLNNLLSNAVKFTPQGGEITVAVQQVQYHDTTGVIRFSVKDTGIGMTQEQVSRLFQPFEQADGSITRRFGGTGLGLSICKGIVEKMNGRIWAESAADEGATFSFEVQLERVEPQLGAHLNDGALPKAVRDFSGITLLLAEDVEINRLIIKALLEDTNINVDMAVDGLQAVEKFSAAPGRYAMVIMDVQMPEMDGLEATRQIRALPAAQAKDVPIIAMTANVFREDVEKCLAAGMNDHLGKPIDAHKLMAMLEEYLPGAGTQTAQESEELSQREEPLKEKPQE